MDLRRQRDLIDSEELGKTKVLLIGAGGIGSFTGVGICKMGIDDLTIYDKDYVEEHNIPNQYFMEDQVEQLKVEALAENIYKFTGVTVDTVNDFWYGDCSSNPDVIITAVDSMAARNDMWANLKANPPKEGTWYIDARMSSQTMSVFVCKFGDSSSVEKYENKALYPSEEAIQEPCTAKAIIYTPLSCAGLVGQILSRIVKKEPVHTYYYGDNSNFLSVKEKQTIS